MRLTYFITVFSIFAVLSACQRTSFNTYKTSPGNTVLSQPRTLAPAPIGDVEKNQLPDLTAPEQSLTAPTLITNQSEQLASNAKTLTKEELIGRWSLTSANQTCDIFLSLTKWPGGYRAASRGCSGNASLISNWDVKEGQLILGDDKGTRVAGLYKVASEYYDGLSNDGQAVSMGR